MPKQLTFIESKIINIKQGKYIKKEVSNKKCKVSEVSKVYKRCEVFQMFEV